MARRALHPVILCGGQGTRLWPASRPDRPKAFLSLTGARSLLQQTALRAGVIPGAASPIAVSAECHAERVLAELEAAGFAASVIAEPTGRGSAPAIAAACLEIAERAPEALVLALACDHFVADNTAFAAGVEAAAPAADAGALVTFGVAPSAPSTAYGYILAGEAAEGAARRIARFVEKPDVARAAALLAEGALWNSGNFLFRADAMLAELARLAPEVVDAASRARRDGARHGRVLRLSEAFASAPQIAIDVAVMEKTSRAAVLPVAYGWSDLGAWDAVLAASARDAEGNAASGEAVLVDARNCLVRAGEGVSVLAIGVRDLAIVVEEGRVLVVDLAQAQTVGPASARLAQP